MDVWLKDGDKSHHDGETRNGQDAHGDENGSLGLIPVADPRRDDHEDAGKHLRRRDQQLGRGDGIAHAPEDYGEEVGNGVRRRREAEVYEGVGPDGHVEAAAGPPLEAEWLDLGVVAIRRDAPEHPAALALRQERPGFIGSSVGEVDEGEVSDAGNEDGDDALHDEDPPPPAVATDSVLGHPSDRARERGREGLGLSHPEPGDGQVHSPSA